MSLRHAPRSHAASSVSSSSASSARAVQRRALQASTVPTRPVQYKGGGDGTAAAHADAARGIQGSGGKLPHGDAIQKSFGRHDVGQIQAHVGGGAEKANEALGSQAYASGQHVAFKGGPDLHTAAHEAAHVVQQKAGVSLKGGIGEKGDKYEQHADQVADAVVQGKSAEGLLDKMAGSGGGGAGVQRKVVQFDGDPEPGRGVGTKGGKAPRSGKPAKPKVETLDFEGDEETFEVATAMTAQPVGTAITAYETIRAEVDLNRPDLGILDWSGQYADSKKNFEFNADGARRLKAEQVDGNAKWTNGIPKMLAHYEGLAVTASRGPVIFKPARDATINWHASDATTRGVMMSRGNVVSEGASAGQVDQTQTAASAEHIAAMKVLSAEQRRQPSSAALGVALERYGNQAERVATAHLGATEALTQARATAIERQAASAKEKLAEINKVITVIDTTGKVVEGFVGGVSQMKELTGKVQTAVAPVATEKVGSITEKGVDGNGKPTSKTTDVEDVVDLEALGKRTETRVELGTSAATKASSMAGSIATLVLAKQIKECQAEIDAVNTHQAAIISVVGATKIQTQLQSLKDAMNELLTEVKAVEAEAEQLHREWEEYGIEIDEKLRKAGALPNDQEVVVGHALETASLQEADLKRGEAQNRWLRVEEHAKSIAKELASPPALTSSYLEKLDDSAAMRTERTRYDDLSQSARKYHDTIGECGSDVSGARARNEDAFAVRKGTSKSSPPNRRK